MPPKFFANRAKAGATLPPWTPPMPDANPAQIYGNSSYDRQSVPVHAAVPGSSHDFASAFPRIVPPPPPTPPIGSQAAHAAMHNHALSPPGLSFSDMRPSPPGDRPPVFTAPRVVLPPTADISASSHLVRALNHPPECPVPRVVPPPAMLSTAKPQATLVDDLKERLIKRRRTEVMEPPPGNWDGNQGKSVIETPPGAWTAPAVETHANSRRTRDPNRRDRSRPRRRDHEHNGEHVRAKTRYADHCRNLRKARSRVDSNAHEARNCDRPHIASTVNIHVEAPSPSSGSSGVGCVPTAIGTDVTTPASGEIADAGKPGLASAPWRASVGTSDTLNNAVKTAPWRTLASVPPCQMSCDVAQGPWNQSGAASTETASNQPRASVGGNVPETSGDSLSPGLEIGDLLNELDKVAAQPDFAELLNAVNEVAPEVVPSSPENMDELSATEDSATEDTDYDPFDIGTDNDPPGEPECENEDEGIVEALFGMLLSAEQDASISEQSDVHNDVSSNSGKNMENVTEPEGEPATVRQVPISETPQDEVAPKSQNLKYNLKTQRWEPRKITTAQEPKATSKVVPEHKTAPRATIDLLGEHEKPRVRAPQPQKNFVIAECEALARADVVAGLASYPQALAVRLALRFESKPADMLKTMEEAGLPAAKDQRSTVKAIMRLCHPDKCKHSLAKRAMQALVQLLS